MKKHVIGLLTGLFLVIKCGGQGLSPFPLLPHPKLQGGKRPLLITCIDNYFSQSNLNAVWIGYYHPLKEGGIYAGAGLKSLSSIHAQIGHIGTIIKVHTTTTLFSEFVFNRETFPEGLIINSFNSIIGFKYNHKNFSIRYEHFLNWNNPANGLDFWRPLQQLTISLKNGNDHEFTVIGQQYQQISPQIILQEELKLSDRWSMSAGLRWPLFRSHLSLKHTSKKWQISICVLAQPQFPPSFNQFYTYALD